MSFTRSAGILLHPTSLPGPDGIGDLGPDALRWVDFLVQAGCKQWQMLPTGPTGYGDSPYQAFSAFAGNPYLISPALLLAEGLLTLSDLADRPYFSAHWVDYGPVIHWKLTVLERAFTRYRAAALPGMEDELAAFAAREASWLDDYALFMAIKESHNGIAWDGWDPALRNRDPQALAAFRDNHPEAILRHVFRQFLFDRQWRALHGYANDKGISIIGDIPIFVAYDSAEVWAQPHLFYLDQQGKPTVVAGVPPDYFSPTGQLWGNPLYRWDVHAAQGFAWWIERVRATLTRYDILRIDHFRGFADYWEVPAGQLTAEKGRWVNGPGRALFDAIRAALGGLPIIAEDLGEITPDVEELRDDLDLPGMKVIQFAFSTDETHPFLPVNYPVNCVAYTGTHDNDTSVGWFAAAPETERDWALRYLGVTGGADIAWDLLRSVWDSQAVITVAPLQDFLALGSEARMNTPGKPGGNWGWRVPSPVLDDEALMGKIADLNRRSLR